PPDEIIVSTHPLERSGWLRRNLVERMRYAAGEIPVEHVVVELAGEDEQTNVLVVANETVLSDALLDRIRERAAAGAASFLIVSPQSDPTQSAHPEAERRLRRALTELRSAGIEAHGQIAHPDPYTAALQAVRDERVDELIVSTFPGARSGWLRRDLVERLRRETKLPV
ncbi:MAG: universal stress protein, partial [Actinobacteria bacterium]|nr:universal stress protein [Actinomycetota bacterium]